VASMFGPFADALAAPAPAPLEAATLAASPHGRDRRAPRRVPDLRRRSARSRGPHSTPRRPRGGALLRPGALPRGCLPHLPRARVLPRARGGARGLPHVPRALPERRARGRGRGPGPPRVAHESGARRASVARRT
jgi:hypothetical protein